MPCHPDRVRRNYETQASVYYDKQCAFCGATFWVLEGTTGPYFCCNDHRNAQQWRPSVAYRITQAQLEADKRAIGR